MNEPEHVTLTRIAYDATADLYAEVAGTEINETTEASVDRALLTAFAEIVDQSGGGTVADVGCGPGRAASYLTARGTNMIGIDPSSAMLEVARRAHPGITFELGTLTSVPVSDRSLAGVVCWYSIIHTPPESLDSAMAELMRVLAPGGHLLMALQSGLGEAVHRTDVLGRVVEFTNYRHNPEDIERSLLSVGFTVTSRTTRAASLPHESTPQTFIFAQSPTS